jgi:hypothetical protein
LFTQEIPLEELTVFLDAFSQRHSGERVTLEVLDRELGPQRLVTDVPLIGGTAEPASPAAGPNDREMRVEFAAGDSPEELESHEVRHPVHVRLAKSDDGADAALEIEPQDGPPLLLRFGGAEGATTFGR